MRLDYNVLYKDEIKKKKRLNDPRMIRGLRGTVALVKSLYSVVVGRKGRIKMYKIVDFPSRCVQSYGTYDGYYKPRFSPSNRMIVQPSKPPFFPRPRARCHIKII